MKTKFSDPVRLPLFARRRVVQNDPYSRRRFTLAATPQEAASLAMNPLDSGVEVYADDRLLPHDAVNDWFFSQDPALRRLAFNAYSDQMALFTDLLSGSRTVHLSSTGLFPNVQVDGLPVAVMLDDAGRKMVDLRWAALFDVQDRRAEPWPGYFKIQDEYHSPTRQQYQPGEQIQLGFVEKEEAIYQHYLYGIGLQWNQLLMAGRWERSRGMTAMLTEWADNQAQLAYETLIAAGFLTQAYDTAGSTALAKDINTINAACDAIRSALYNDTATIGGQALKETIPDGQPFYLLFNNLTATYRDRIDAALAVRYGVTQSSGDVAIKELAFPIIPVGSPHVTTGHWYVVLPRRKNVYSIFRSLAFYDFMDPRVAGVAEGQVGWGAERALRADTNQVVRLALS